MALAQAQATLAQCRQAFPELDFEIKIIKTTGDKLQTASLSQPNLPKGLFTKELEQALLDHEADLAVHSLKDLPTTLPDGLILGGVSPRADPRDVLVFRTGLGEKNSLPSTQPSTPEIRSSETSAAASFSLLPPGATVATSSVRRACQLQAVRPDIRIVPIRGNVGTRLDKLASQPGVHATILAAAGLERLAFHIDPDGRLRGANVPESLAARVLPCQDMIPCVGQGALGFEVRQDDRRLLNLCARLEDLPTRRCVTAERSFLQAMGGGCQLAVAAYAQPRGDEIHLLAVSFLDGRKVGAEGRAPFDQAENLGRQIASKLRGPR